MYAGVCGERGEYPEGDVPGYARGEDGREGETGVRGLFGGGIQQDLPLEGSGGRGAGRIQGDVYSDGPDDRGGDESGEGVLEAADKQGVCTV